MKLRFPHDLDPDRFLRDYWQRRPLLMRQALPGYRTPLSPDELAGLACEPEVESRLVLERDGERPWEARHGPFDDGDFAALPRSHWTLLVQDLDKHLPEAAALLEPFRFLPDWRVDDVMISYAADQGSVGPHVDDYDVFLVQALGRRRWRIHTRPVDPDRCIPGLDLRILPEFEAQQDWLLEPGDVLYLPPNVAHWGIAEGDECMTCSVGFRAPAWRDMAQSWCDALIERRMPAGRYLDPPLRPQQESAEIRPEVFERVARQMEQLARDEPALMQEWLGRHLTETKDNLQTVAAQPPLSPAEFTVELERHGRLLRSGYARLAFSRGDRVNRLFANGRCHELHPGHVGFLHAITQERSIHAGYLAPWLAEPECLDVLCRLYNDGIFEFPDE
jgi:50S ribosomal protein L16 3-hydroxylase